MTSHADEVTTTLSASQQGVVTRKQLVAAGVSTDTVEYRVKRGPAFLRAFGIVLSSDVTCSLP